HQHQRQKLRKPKLATPSAGSSLALVHSVHLRHPLASESQALLRPTRKQTRTMDDSKTPFLSEEARSSSDSSYTFIEKSNDAPQSHPELGRSWSVTARTKRAFRIALVIWLGVAFVTYLALHKGGCSRNRKPVVTGMEGRIPGGGALGGGGSGKLGYKVVEDLPKKLIPQPGGY